MHSEFSSTLLFLACEFAEHVYGKNCIWVLSTVIAFANKALTFEDSFVAFYITLAYNTDIAFFISVCTPLQLFIPLFMFDHSPVTGSMYAMLFLTAKLFFVEDIMGPNVVTQLHFVEKTQPSEQEIKRRAHMQPVRTMLRRDICIAKAFVNY